MTYHTHMSGVADDVMSLAKQVSGSVDPYLPEVLCRVDQIRALQTDRTFVQGVFGKKATVPVPACPRPAVDVRKGVGVVLAVRPLRGAAYLYSHPTVVAIGLAAVVAIPYLLGYSHGKGRSR
jgi:hypothetical protein